MRVVPTLNRLIAECPLFEGRWALASSVETMVKEEPSALPDGKLIIPDERAGEESTDTLSTQAVFADIALLVFAEMPDTVTGVEQLEDARAEIMAALHGWQPDASTNPLLYTEGKPLNMTASRILYLYEFVAEQPVALRSP